MEEVRSAPPETAARAARAAAGAGAVLALVWLTWGVGDLSPHGGLDPSWLAGLYMAAAEGLGFGSDLVFTYGPLGYLAVPCLYYDDLAAAAASFGVVVHALLAAALLAISRERAGRWIGFAVAFVCLRAGTLTGTPELLGLLVFLGCLHCLRAVRGTTGAYYVVAAAGITSSFALLLKFNVGVAAAVISGITSSVLGVPRWRLVAAWSAALLVSFVALWSGTGNDLADIPAFLSGSIEIARGYSEAMTYDEPGRGWELLAAGAVLLAFGGLAWSELRAWPPGRRAAGAVVCAIFVAAAFKQGFVRHDAHSAGFFIPVVIACAAFGPPRRRYLALVPIVVLPPLVAATLRMGAWEVLDPRPSARALISVGSDLADPEARAAVAANARAALRSHYSLDPATLEAVKGRTVHVHPWETTVAWAYPEVAWRPLPVFQSYSAYTESLDRRNADFLASRDAPERILQGEPAALDGRNPDFEPPATNLAMLCHYASVSATGRWQVLAKTSPRCGAPEEIGAGEGRLGEWIAVPTPEPGHVVYAEIDGLSGALLQRVATMLYRAPEIVVEIDSGTYRLTPGTAGNPLILHVPAEANFPPPFDLGGTTRFRIMATGPFVSIPSFDVRFYGVRIE